MSDNKQELNLATLLGVDDMPEAQREEFLERVGGIIIEASIGRLLVSLEDDQVSKLEAYMNTVSEEDDIFAHFLRTYPDFQSIVEGEITALREQAIEVLGD